MKILHALHGFPPEYEGGTELYVASLSSALAERGHEIRILAGSGETARQDRLDEESFPGIGGRAPEPALAAARVHRLHRGGVFFEEWPRAWSPGAERLIDGLLESERPDLVHVHHWKRLTTTLVDRAARAGIPSVVTFHDLASTCARDFRLRDGSFCEARFLETDCEHCVRRYPWQEEDALRRDLAELREDFAEELRLATRLLAPTRAHADRVADLHRIDASRIEAIGLGPVRTLRPANRDSATRFPTRPLRVAHWAHMNDVKGSHVVLEALVELERLDPAAAERVEVVLLGPFVTPEYEARMRGLAEGRRVEFLGRFGPGDLERLEADLAVVPSITAESYAYVVDEAFDLGLPVLGSDLGALPERIGEAGAVFAAGDAAALAERLHAVIQDPSSLEGWRAAVRDSRPDMSDHAARVQAVYEAALASEIPTPRADAERLRARLENAAERLEERRVALLDLEARVGYVTASSWKAESDLVEAQEKLARIERDARGRHAGDSGAGDDRKPEGRTL